MLSKASRSSLGSVWHRRQIHIHTKMMRHAARRFFLANYRRTISTVREPGPVGLSEGDNPRKSLTELYNQTLAALKDIPEDAAYRVNMEKITNHRLSVVESTEDIEKIEATLNIGQISEIMEQAENELELIPHMAEWKPWQAEPSSEPAVIKVID